MMFPLTFGFPVTVQVPFAYLPILNVQTLIQFCPATRAELGQGGNSMTLSADDGTSGTPNSP